MTINGPASANVIVNGNAMSRILDVDDQDPSIPIDVSISNLTLTNGNAGSNIVDANSETGGAILNHGTLALDNCTISACFAAGSGGGIDNEGTVSVSNSTITGNTSYVEAGGGIYGAGPSIVSDSTIADNQCLGATGGGICNIGGLLLNNSTIVGNGAQEGGGTENLNFSFNDTNVLNSTITGNYTVATRPGFGSGGGIYDLGNMTLIGSIVAGNTAVAGAADISSGGITGYDNLIGDGSGITYNALVNGVNGNQIGTTAHPIDPMLGQLAKNGGLTQTMMPLPGSPALNAGGPFAKLWNPVGLSDTTIIVNSLPAGWNFADEFVIQIDNEQIVVDVDASLPNTLDIDQRGYDGTLAANHNASVGVFFAYDQRGQPRIFDGHTDVGAVEMTRMLSITAAFGATSIPLDGTTTLRFTISNPFPETAFTGVAFTDTLPAGLSVVHSSARVGGGTLTTTAPTGIALSGATIAAGVTLQFSVIVTGAAIGSYSDITGPISSSNGGTDGTSNTATLAVYPPLRIAQTIVSPTPIYEGSIFAYTITVGNLGSAAISGVTVRDALPSDAVFLGSLPFGFSIRAGVLTINVGTVAGNSNRTFAVWTYVPLSTGIGASITNDISVLAAESGAVDLYTSIYTFIVAKPKHSA